MAQLPGNFENLDHDFILTTMYEILLRCRNKSATTYVTLHFSKYNTIHKTLDEYEDIDRGVS